MTKGGTSATKKPLVFTVFGVVNVVIGAFSAMAVPLVLIMVGKTLLAPEDPRFVVDLRHQWLFVGVRALRLLLPFVILGSGILLWRGRGSGRWLAVVWILLSALELAVSVHLDWSTVIVPLLDHSELRDPGAAPNLAESLGAVTGRALFTVGYLGFVLRFLFLDRTVREYLAHRRREMGTPGRL